LGATRAGSVSDGRTVVRSAHFLGATRAGSVSDGRTVAHASGSGCLLRSLLVQPVQNDRGKVRPRHRGRLPQLHAVAAVVVAALGDEAPALLGDAPQKNGRVRQPMGILLVER